MKIKILLLNQIVGKELFDKLPKNGYRPRLRSRNSE